jgi:hypothetical protein
MATTLIRTLELQIEKLEDDKADYYAENHNQTDSHIMWLQGQIDGIKYTIKMIIGTPLLQEGMEHSWAKFQQQLRQNN